MVHLMSGLLLSLLQVNYRAKVLGKGIPSSLYSQLPDTAEIQFAREMTELQSEVQHRHTDCSLQH